MVGKKSAGPGNLLQCPDEINRPVAEDHAQKAGTKPSLIYRRRKAQSHNHFFNRRPYSKLSTAAIET
jgi:hypothetical protein